ncbi:hypothetical protein B0H16DRAFT_1806213, partial [Mycena metata]
PSADAGPRSPDCFSSSTRLYGPYHLPLYFFTRYNSRRPSKPKIERQFGWKSPPRKRRTHPYAEVTAALMDLPSESMCRFNREMMIRNAERALQKAKHAYDPDSHADALDNESLITISDDEDEAMSPASRLYDAVQKLSPKTGKGLLRTFGGSAKRGREEKKDVREEVVIAAGMSLPIVFHKIIRELYEHDIYIPLSIFTIPSLILINANAAVVDMVKLNATWSADKQLRVMSTVAFENKMEGAESAMVARWEAHFGFFTGVQDVELNFTAIRATDITIRLRYNALPFTFTHSLYRDDLQKEILALRIEESGNGGSAHGAAHGAFHGPYGGYGGYNGLPLHRRRRSPLGGECQRRMGLAYRDR